MFQGQTYLPGTITSDMMRFTARPVAQIARLPGTPAPPRMFTDQLTGKQVTQAEVDSLGGMQTFLDSNAPKQERNLQDRQYGQVAPPRQFEPKQRAGMGYQPRPMAQPAQLPQPAQQLGGMFNQPQQQRGGMFGQQNQFNPQGMQQMMQFMQQMMQMFSMMGGQNRGGGFGGGFGGQQQYQQPQRYQPQQYQPPRQQPKFEQFQPAQQQYGQMGPQQPSPFAQSIKPRY